MLVITLFSFYIFFCWHFLNFKTTKIFMITEILKKIVKFWKVLNKNNKITT